MKVKSNNKGLCPMCNSNNLEYDCVQFEEDMAYFPWHCRDCGCEGEEWYYMEFNGHNINDENGSTEIEPHMIESEEE